MPPASTAGGMGLIHGWGTKILHPICHIAWLKKKKREMDRAGHNKTQGHRLEEGQKQKVVSRMAGGHQEEQKRQQLKFRVQSIYEETGRCGIQMNILRIMDQTNRTKHSTAGVWLRFQTR